MRERSGAASVHMIVILVPVLFGLMGFALDLGRMYLVRGELQAAANSMALAAAAKLIGTDASTDAATTAAQLTLNDTNGYANRYDFAGLKLGETTGSLSSTVSDPGFFSTMADATAADSTSGSVAGSAAKYARVQITAEAPLVFWSFLPIATDRKATIAAAAVAGVSAPLCVACGIQPMAIAARDTSDTVDFGYTTATRYTFAFSCTGNPTPTGLAGATSVVTYLVLDRLDPNPTAFTDEQSQLFRIGANGLPGNPTESLACFTINNTETIWATAIPGACSAASPPSDVFSMLCGVTTRFESSLPAACSNIPDVDTLSTLYAPDSDVSDITDYTQYLGNGRRVITIPIVDALSSAGSMTVLGFRQFLIEPDPNGVDITPADRYGRFAAMYLGSVMPLRQGRFSGCTQTSGPGKVVLHQ